MDENENQNQIKVADTVDFTLSGEYVASLADKSFEIVLPPYKETGKSYKNPGETWESLMLVVKLSTGETVKYRPNNRSQKAIVAKRGYNPQNWLGYKGQFITVKQMVGDKGEIDVIYVKNG